MSSHGRIQVHTLAAGEGGGLPYEGNNVALHIFLFSSQDESKDFVDVDELFSQSFFGECFTVK